MILVVKDMNFHYFAKKNIFFTFILFLQKNMFEAKFFESEIKVFEKVVYKSKL